MSHTRQSKTPADNLRTRPLLDLFPAVNPYSTGFLDVDDTHSLYWEQCGNPDGVPIVFLHGGPGGGISPKHRRFFDPDFFRIILFDQRGAGRSSPLGSLKNNTTEHLIEDLCLLKDHLKVDQWHVFGGSWGSTLALSYAQTHPDHCLSLILRGIFLLEQEELDWFVYGMKTIFPEAWEQFVEIIPVRERKNIIKAYYKRLTHKDPAIVEEAAIRWTLYESACASLLPNYETITTAEQKRSAMAIARLECHYFLKNVIKPENSLLKGIDKIRSIPATIVQGRYDVICPIQTAHKLHQAWPEADYIVVPDAGHSSSDPGIRSRLIEATENIKKLAKKKR